MLGGGHHVHRDGEVGLFHLAFQDRLELGDRAVEGDRVAGIEGGPEERQALYVVPMEMRKEKMAIRRVLGRRYLVPEFADSRAGVEDEAAALPGDHFDARGIAADGREEVIRQGRQEELARLLARDVLGRDPLDRR